MRCYRFQAVGGLEGTSSDTLPLLPVFAVDRSKKKKEIETVEKVTELGFH